MDLAFDDMYVYVWPLILFRPKTNHMSSKSKSISWDCPFKAIVKTGVFFLSWPWKLFYIENVWWSRKNVAGSDEGGVLWPEPGGGAEPHSCAPAGPGGPLLSGGASFFTTISIWRKVNIFGREMENISTIPTFGDFVTIRTEASTQDVTVARLQSTRVQNPLSPLF